MAGACRPVRGDEYVPRTSTSLGPDRRIDRGRPLTVRADQDTSALITLDVIETAILELASSDKVCSYTTLPSAR